MQEPNLFIIFLDKFNLLDAPYMVTGSVASIVYGEPRLTHDIDLVLVLNVNKIDEFIAQFPDDEFYCPPSEILLSEATKKEKGHCNLLHHETGFKADIYFAGDDEFQHWALENVNVIRFFEIEIPLAPAEYVIVKKLEFYKEGLSQKHLLDIKSILNNYGNSIDFNLLEGFILKFNLLKEWEKVKT